MTSRHNPSPSGPRAAVVGLLLLPASLTAAPFLYAPGDLILELRSPGNASDLVVNLGSVTNYNHLAEGGSITPTALDAAQLRRAFPSITGLSWSVSGASRPPGVGDLPLQTLWVTAPRLEATTQSPPWLRKGQFLQGNAASRIEIIGLNAAAASSSQPAGPDNSPQAVTISSSGDYSVSPILGTEADLGGNFQGAIEATTADDFDTAPAAASRLDLYELLPGRSSDGTLDQPGRYLGYFELHPDASLTFSRPSALPPAPNITSIEAHAGTTRVSFTTVPGAHYQLLRTNAAGLTSPASSWPPLTTITGTGANLSLEDPAAAENAFYRIQVTP